ncbi:hypothetical protein [Nonomuraea endophytica]|uniref:hypothetical protein n=1 Tax=Nonomuraea endophytica TaxID=714136 RepID=UPI0037CA9E23
MDPLSFPMLAGAALSQAFAFLFGRLAHVLDNRKNPSVEAEQIDMPEVLEGDLQPLQANAEIIDDNILQLQALSGKLSTYERNSDRVVATDEELLEDLGELRYLLEQIYGQQITFAGEDRASSGVRVNMHLGTLAGDARGIEADVVRNAQVSQTADQVTEGARIIGVKGKRVG